MQPADKPRVDMSFCLGYIEKMLLACKPKLSAKDYNRLRVRVLGEESYLRQKEIFSQYVDIYIRKQCNSRFAGWRQSDIFLPFGQNGRKEEMNSFMSWVGGKKALRDEVLIRFPPYYERYIEVFGGAGWVLFHKPPGMDFEVYNDFNSNLANLYRCVRQNPNKLKYKLRYVLNSREDFDYIALLHKRGIFQRLRDYDRAAKFYQLIRYSYASGLDSFASQPHSIWADFPMIDLAAWRLQKVIVENKDFEKLIRQYDRPVSFFYCDPPYFATESYYKDVGFGKADHVRLMETLTGIKGKFLVSYNDCPEIREIWDRPGIQIEPIERLNNLAQRYDGGCMFAEVLISNYDTGERMNMNRQMSLFDYDYDGGLNV